MLDSPSAASHEARRDEVDGAPTPPAADPPTPGPSSGHAPGGPSRRAWSLIVLAAAALLAAIIVSTALRDGASTATSGAESDWAGAVLDPARPRPDFTLTDTEGRPFDFAAETAGTLTFLYFGYTNCPDICPVHLATLNQALRAEPDLAATVVFVTTDPERDGPEQIRSWLDRFNGAFIGLTGTPEEIRAAEVASGVAPAAADTPGEDGFYLVAHAAEIILFTPDDQAHLTYPFGTRQTDWLADLDRIVDRADWWDAAAGAPTGVGADPTGVDAAGDAAPGAVATVGSVRVTDAFAGEGAAGGIASAYFVLDNPGPATELIGAESDVAGRVVVHTVDPSGAMTELDGLELPVGTTALQPGGTHLMLEDLRRSLAPGDTVSITLHLADGSSATVPMTVVAYDAVLDRADRGRGQDVGQETGP